MEIDTSQNETEREGKPRKNRQTKADRKVYVYRMIDGTPKEFGSFPETVVGQPIERRVLPFLKEINVESGDYKVELRNAKGHFERSFDFSIAEEIEKQDFVDVEMVDLQTEAELDESDYDVSSNEVEMRAELISLRREMRELRERERERTDAAKESESSALMMIREMQKQSEKSFQQGLQMAQMIIQSSQPKDNPSELMLSMLKGTLEVQRGVRELSEEISPSQATSSGGSLLADGAKLLDSVGRNAGTFLPLLTGLVTRQDGPASQPSPPTRFAVDSPPAGELDNLAARIRDKKQATASVDSRTKKEEVNKDE